MKGMPKIKDTEVAAAYEQVIDPESSLNWIVFTCTDKDDVVLVGSGPGGIEEVIKAMKEKDLSLGFLKLAEDSYGLINCFSLEATSERITSALLMLQEAKLLFTHHYLLDITKPEDLTLEALKAGAREAAEVEAAKPLKKRSTIKKKKEGADGEEKVKKKKKTEGDKEGEEVDEDGTKRRNTVRKKKSDTTVADATGELKTMTIEKTDSSNGLKRGKSVKKKTEDAEKKSKKRGDDAPETPTISIDEAPLERQKSVKPKSKKNTDELQPKEHVKELSGSSSPMYKHSRDPSASSEISEEGTRQYCKALNYNLAKTPDDLMFVKGDIIQIVEKMSETKWLGICCGVEGVFDPALVSVLPAGYRPKMDASGSEMSMDSFSDIISESEYDEDEVAGRNKARAGELSEPMVVDWLYSAGFPQYVDMYQKRQVINEGEVVHDHSFLSPLQIQSLLKRIRFLNLQTQKSMGTAVDVQQYQNSDALPISPMWNDSNTTPSTPTNPGYDSLPTGTQQAGWGENLTRSKSKKKKKARSISDLDAREMDVARKLAVLSITAMQEKSNKTKVADFAVKTFNKIVSKKEEKEAKIFGGDLQEVVERTGVPSKWTTGVIPKCLFKMFESLEKEEILKTVGLFRVPGKQGRINQIRDQCDDSDGDVDFSGLSGADLSGLLKLFFAKLPDSLFTSELYKTYILVASMTNKRVQIETLQLLSILLPKENREIAACLLKFLSQVSQHKEENKMDTKNIALVLAPTLFGDKRKKALKPTQADIDKDLQRQNKIAEVLQVMIDCQSVLWMLPVDLQEQLEYTSQGGKSEKKKRWFFNVNKYPTL